MAFEAPFYFQHQVYFLLARYFAKAFGVRAWWSRLGRLLAFRIAHQGVGLPFVV
jgi:hypothetical protein